MNWKLPAVPATKLVLVALVMAGCSFTVTVKLCVAAVPTLLLAVMVTVLAPPVPATGVPVSTPVSISRPKPLGRVPAVTLNLGAGKPVAVTVKAGPAVPTVKVALAALVMVGDWPTVRVNDCVALVPTPLPATMASVKMPLCSGVPLSEPALVSVTPVGSALEVLKLAAG